MSNPPNGPASNLAPTMHDELKAIVETALPQTPAQFAERMIRKKWGAGIDPNTAQLVTLHYDYWLRTEQDGTHLGCVASTQSLVQALLANYQTVGDGHFYETAFGIYTPHDVGPAVRIMEKAEPTDDHRTYEGIYRHTVPQVYGPQTQISIRPAAFKKWVWIQEPQELYQTYVDNAWPSDEVILGVKPCALKTSTKAAFVMTAWLQRRENSLTQKGLELAMQAAGLPAQQTWETLTLEQLQGVTRLPSSVDVGRLRIYRYTATDIWCYRDRVNGRVLMYIPGNSSPLHEFTDTSRLRGWLVDQSRGAEAKQALAMHFSEDDRNDGTFHAGVLTALDGMAIYPEQHRLTKEAGFFNDDGYWEPAEYIDFERAPSGTDPFAKLVLVMKQAAQASVKTIRSDGQVNRDNLSAFVEPIVQWINQFGPLALFVPGGEGLLVLAGLIDAGYGLDQALNAKTANERSQGVVRTIFGLLNALPLAGGIDSLKGEGAQAASISKAEAEIGEPMTPSDTGPAVEPAVSETPGRPVPGTLTRVDLLRGIGVPAGTFSDEVLAQIGKVCAVDDDMLRLMQAGRAPTPLLADTVDRFRIDQEVTALGDVSTAQAEFNRRYQVLQQSEHEWVRLFQKTYPDLPKTAIEQLLDRYGVDVQASPEPDLARELFKRLDHKARQYQQHVRINRAYEALYLRSVTSAESDTLALHSLTHLPGWSKRLAIEVIDGSPGGRMLDRSGPIDAPETLRLIKVQERYQPYSLSAPTAEATGFYEAVASVLSREERTALQLLSADPGAELKIRISEHALSRAELIVGLGRTKSGLTFEAQGLKGGGFPGTLQGEALAQAMKRMQLREIYPDLTDTDADVELARMGGGYVVRLDQLNVQLQQLIADMNDWVDRVALDITDMGVPLLNLNDPEAAGMNAAQLAAHNAELIQEAMAHEAQGRMELADEIVSIWRKRPPRPHSRYAGNPVTGFTMDLDNESFHRLPAFNVRLNDVVGLNMHNFQMNVISSLDEFLEALPNLQTLDLSDTDLRFDLANGQQDSELPALIPELKHLTSLNLRNTHLRLSERSAGKLSELTHLQLLDMSDNPLGEPPLVMGMDQLRYLNLENTGITRCPVGILERPYLTMLNLRGNQISRVPQAVLNQAVARDRVLLWNNPITDEDTLQRLVRHREQTGLNLWLSEAGVNYSDPAAWMNGIDGPHQNALFQMWQRLSLRQHGGRFLGTMNTLTLTADYQVNYLDLQTRVWRLLTEADASQELWERLSQDVRMPAGAFDNPFAAFSALEERARLYNDWVALGRPFPVE